MKTRIPVLEKKLIHPMSETFHDYLKDESKMTGSAESISFPENEADIRNILQVMRDRKIPVTIQGGKTGVVGSAVPLVGHIMNLSHMTKVKSFAISEEGEMSLVVEPGITLRELRNAIQRLETHQDFFWPPDPSEPTASVGGIASTNANGICFHLYGKAASYISGIRVINADGFDRDLKKGQERVVINGVSHDLLDVYLGGEGMYGVITELTLRLIPKPKEIWGLGFFFEDPEDGMSFADELNATSFEVQGASLAAIEFLDHTILNALVVHHPRNTRFNHTPDLVHHASAMIYVEIHGNQEDAIEEIAQTLMMMGSNFNGDPDKTWAFSGEPEMDKMRTFLHAAAETAILHIAKIRSKDSRITKLGLSISLEQDGLRTLVRRYEKELQKKHLKACFWGHMGGNSLHVDMLPESYGEFVKGRALLEAWAEKFPVSIKSAITSYGIGKLKKSIFLKTASKTTIDDIIQLKKQLDMNNLWNPGNML
ncbi:FAD-binding oxidoreductase [Thermodesulfobacteriota bacterium]